MRIRDTNYAAASSLFANLFGWTLFDISSLLDGVTLTLLGSGLQGAALRADNLPFAVVRHPQGGWSFENGVGNGVTILKMVDVGPGGVGFDMNETIPYAKLNADPDVFPSTGGGGIYTFGSGGEGSPHPPPPIPQLRWLAYTSRYHYREGDNPDPQLKEGSFMVMAMTVAPGITLDKYADPIFARHPGHDLGVVDIDAVDDSVSRPTYNDRVLHPMYNDRTSNDRVLHPMYNVLVFLQLLSGLFYGLLRIHRAGVALVDIHGGNAFVWGPHLRGDGQSFDIVGAYPTAHERLVMRPTPLVTFIDFGGSCAELWKRDGGERVDTCTFGVRGFSRDPMMAPELAAGDWNAPISLELGQAMATDVYALGAWILSHLVSGMAAASKRGNTKLGTTVLRGNHRLVDQHDAGRGAFSPANLAYLQRVMGVRGAAFDQTIGALMVRVLGPMVDLGAARRATMDRACEELEIVCAAALEFAGVPAAGAGQQPSGQLDAVVSGWYVEIMSGVFVE